jgi:hypothetical protein
MLQGLMGHSPFQDRGDQGLDRDRFRRLGKCNGNKHNQTSHDGRSPCVYEVESNSFYSAALYKSIVVEFVCHTKRHNEGFHFTPSFSETADFSPTCCYFYRV